MAQKHATQIIKDGLADARAELEAAFSRGAKPRLNSHWIGSLGEHEVAKALNATHAGHRVEQYDLEWGAENIEVKSTTADTIRRGALSKKRCNWVAYVQFEAEGANLRVTTMYIRPRGKPGDRPSDPENRRVGPEDRVDLLPSPGGYVIDLSTLG
ncbi:hypothetical protein [Erythrobacter donghaensis]|jgi:hypothetical protein|uniref:hypothetical protein n=1 Tax=Erythrobacter donghaensis TaxID=267135 RepID=UPI0012D9A424|nr:hypothetical protein [Erythrobacter donghaensis]